MPFAEKAVADTGVGGTATFKNKRRFKAVLILWKQLVIYGLLIPFVGTSLGSACVFFLKKGLGDRVQRGLTGFASGVHGCCVYLEPADSCYGSILRGGFFGLSASGHWLLGWHPLSAGVRSSDSTPPSKESPRRRASYAVAALYHDGAGCHPS